MRVTRAPDDLRGKILRQFLDQSSLGIKAEHDIAMFPRLFGLGADRIMMQKRYHPGRGLHLLDDFLHPGGLAMSHDDFHRGVSLHDRKANQGRCNEHVVVEPVGEDRRHRMAERRSSSESGSPGRAAAAPGKWSA